MKNMQHMIAKEDKVSFLRGHVSQLTQSISQLPYHHLRKRPGLRAGGSFGDEEMIRCDRSINIEDRRR